MYGNKRNDKRLDGRVLAQASNKALIGDIGGLIAFSSVDNGDFINRDTKALWSDAVHSLFGVAEYGGAKVKIAYNEDKDKVIVLGR